MKAFLKLAIHIIVGLVILCNLRGSSKVTGQLQDYMDFNLGEDVAIPTVPSCDFKRRSIKRRLNESSHEKNVTNVTRTESTITPITTKELSFDEAECIVYSDTCPDEVKISWLQAAPFVYDTSRTADNKSDEHSPTLKGIFHDIVTRSIGICCKTFSGGIPQIRYLKRASSLRVLQRELLHGSADLIIPVHSDEVKYGGNLPYVKILDSPGVVLIQKHPTLYQWKLVLKAILGTWPVVILALLMSFTAGAVIWLLDSSHNPEQFSRTFHRGVFQGFWWAFVTITTIGYGDKAPKSALARAFAVVWITVGITLCSVMTATLSSALMNVKVEEYDFSMATGKRIGVLSDSVAFQDAANLAANIQTFEDVSVMYDELKREDGIEGILEEFFTGIESMKTNDTPKELSIAKMIWNSRGFGVAYRNFLFTERVSGCLLNVIKFRYNDVLKITNNYIQRTKAAEGQKMLSDSEPDAIKVFDSHSPQFLACVVALSIIPLVCLVVGRIILFTKHFKSQQQKGASYSENSTSRVVCFQDEKSSSIFLNGQQHTEV